MFGGYVLHSTWFAAAPARPYSRWPIQCARLSPALEPTSAPRPTPATREGVSLCRDGQHHRAARLHRREDPRPRACRRHRRAREACLCKCELARRLRQPKAPEIEHWATTNKVKLSMQRASKVEVLCARGMAPRLGVGGEAKVKALRGASVRAAVLCRPSGRRRVWRHRSRKLGASG